MFINEEWHTKRKKIAHQIWKGFFDNHLTRIFRFSQCHKYMYASHEQTAIQERIDAGMAHLGRLKRKR